MARWIIRVNHASNKPDDRSFGVCAVQPMQLGLHERKPARADHAEPFRHSLCGTPLEARWFCPTCGLPVAESEAPEQRVSSRVFDRRTDSLLLAGEPSGVSEVVVDQLRHVEHRD